MISHDWVPGSYSALSAYSDAPQHYCSRCGIFRFFNSKYGETDYFRGSVFEWSNYLGTVCNNRIFVGNALGGPTTDAVFDFEDCDECILGEILVS